VLVGIDMVEGWEVGYFVVGEVLVYHDCEVQGISKGRVDKTM
jgi:hypothetical protein